MEQGRCLAVLLSSMVWMGSGLALAQPVMEKPTYAVGDSWEFKQTTSPGDKVETLSRAIVEVLPDGRFRVRFQNNTINEFDAAMNFMFEGNPDYTRVLVKYPLKVGNEWSPARKFQNPGTGESGEAKVVAYESITVPAGTFECYRVEAKATLNNKANYYEARTWKRWYCPDVKWIAKDILETQHSERNNPAANGTTVQTLELVKFTPGK